MPVFRTCTFGTGFVSSVFFCISSFLFLLRNADKYDILHLHLASSHVFPAILIKKLLGKKIILKFGGARKTGDIQTSLLKPFGNLKLKIIKKSFDAFVVPGNEVLIEIISAGFPKDKIHLIPNGVDINIFKPVNSIDKIELRKKLNIPTGGFICIYAGRIEKGKGLDILLHSWKNMNNNIHLLIIGEGKLLKNFRSSFLQKNIHFYGFQKNINDFMATGDLFILPSFGEGLSNAILEAMSSGLIVLANNIPANVDIITNYTNGILLNFNDTGNVISMISKICTDIKSYSKLGICARQTATEKFSLPYIAERYFQLYKKVLDKT